MADVPKNPNRVEFDSPDHALVTGYALTMVNIATGEVIGPTEVGKGELVNGKVVVVINVQPIKFGRFHTIAVARAEGVESVPSAPSNEWQRAPGAPGGVTVG